MVIKQEPFVRYNEEKVADNFTVRLNAEERVALDEAKKILHQSKDSTAIKQLAMIGTKTIQDQKMLQFLEVVLNNYRKNKRLGIVDFD